MLQRGFVIFSAERTPTDGDHLDELRLGVDKHNPQRFVREKAHLGGELRDRQGRVDQEP
jgi:hypothetical protein